MGLDQDLLGRGIECGHQLVTAIISFSVVVTMSWLVRGSATTWLRAERVGLTSVTMFVGSQYFSWIILDTSGSGAAGSLIVTRAIRSWDP